MSYSKFNTPGNIKFLFSKLKCKQEGSLAAIIDKYGVLNSHCIIVGGVSEQNSFVNKCLCADAWTAERAIIASNALSVR